MSKKLVQNQPIEQKQGLSDENFKNILNLLLALESKMQTIIDSNHEYVDEKI